MKLSDFLTDDQVQTCVDIVTGDTPKLAEYMPKGVVDRIETEVIKPALADINRKLGQENDSRYLAYMVVYAIQTGAHD